MGSLNKLNIFIDEWIRAPEANAAGRLGLFRILYAVFYLGTLSTRKHERLAFIPASEWDPVPLWAWLTVPPSSKVLLGALETVLVLGLICLLIGIRVRAVTWLVLIVGLLLDGLRYSFGKIDHDDTFLVAYIPFIMGFSAWGATYSIDSLIRRRCKQESVDASDSSSRYGWPIRAVLLLLAQLFTMAGCYKIVGGWLGDFYFLRNLLYERNIGPRFTALHLFVSDTPVLSAGLQVGTVLFECLFISALFSRRLRVFFTASAVLFHFLSFLLIHVNFHHMMITYAIFVDWQKLLQRLRPKCVKLSRGTVPASVPAVVVGCLILGTAGDLLWNSTTIPRGLLSTLFDTVVIWSTSLTVAMYALAKLCFSLSCETSISLVRKL